MPARAWSSVPRSSTPRPVGHAAWFTSIATSSATCQSASCAGGFAAQGRPRPGGPGSGPEAGEVVARLHSMRLGNVAEPAQPCQRPWEITPSPKSTGAASKPTTRSRHGVHRLLDGLSHDPTQALTHPLVVDLDHIAQPTSSAILVHGGSLLNWLSSVVFANTNLTRVGATALCAKDSLRHPPSPRSP